jgi:hypothetical protein
MFEIVGFGEVRGDVEGFFGDESWDILILTLRARRIGGRGFRRSSRHADEVGGSVFEEVMLLI